MAQRAEICVGRENTLVQSESASLSSSSEQAQRPSHAEKLSEHTSQVSHAETFEGLSGTQAIKAIPTRPKVMPVVEYSPISGQTGPQSLPSALRPRRLTSTSSIGSRGETPLPRNNSLPVSEPGIFLSADDPVFSTEPREHLPPGSLLHEKRYCLRTILNQQNWLPGAGETLWAAQDSQRGGATVVICEVLVPECGLIELQSFLRRATIALTSIGRHQHIPMLWDVFSEQSRHFFVFEPVDGESLAERVARSQQPLLEVEAIECCIQMAEVLDFLSQQSSPLVHGRICPEHIVANRSGTRYLLTSFSPLLAGEARQFVLGAAMTGLTPFSSRKFSQNPFDAGNDFYALLASMYYVLTGHLPTENPDVAPPTAWSINPTLSMECSAILEKGLHPLVDQRYQSAAALLSDLRTLRSVQEGHNQQSGSLASVQRLRQSGGPRATPPLPRLVGDTRELSAAHVEKKELSSMFSVNQRVSYPPEEPIRTQSDSGMNRDLGSQSQSQQESFLQKVAQPNFLLVGSVVALIFILIVMLVSHLPGR
jgi:serine/threonine protein kinase